MRRSWTLTVIAVALAAVVIAPLSADVKTREHSLVKFEGMLGKVFGMFGGKAAREGIISAAAVKGTRKSSLNDNTGQIIDLAEEKVYDLDIKKKTYKVTTFEELRRRIKEEQERAAREAEKERAREEGRQEKAEQQQPRKEWDVDFDVKETGQKKQIAGYDTREVIMTVTVREKGKTLEDAGGFVMTSDSWLGPEIKSLRELTDFDRKYYEKLYGTETMGLAAEQMAMVLAMYPMLQTANERLKKEGAKLEGTPLASSTTFEAVKSKAMLEEETKQQGSSSGGGIGGMLARKMMKKEPPKARATVMTLTHEYQEVATSVAATDLAIPADFKEKK